MGIPPAPRGMPQIEVTFDIDANGILNVTAKDTATSKEQKITITASTGLSKDEAEKMRHDAEAHAEEDRRKLAEIEARNTLDNRVYQIEKLLRENREKLAESEVKAVEEALEKAKSALAGGSLDTIQSADAGTRTRFAQDCRDALPVRCGGSGSGFCGTGSRRWASGGSPEAGQQKKPGEGEVIDAEYVDVDESKRPN